MVDDTYGFDHAADVRFGPVVRVRWVDTVGTRRTSLERGLGLFRGEHSEGTTWSYRVPDASPQRLLAIVAHDMVADTNGFDRGSLELNLSEGDVALLAVQPLVYAGGWHQPESDPTAPELSWRWTQQTATLSFANPNADAAFYLDYTARPDLVTGAPQTVTVRAGDQVLQSFVAHTVGRASPSYSPLHSGAGHRGTSRDTDRRGPHIRVGDPGRWRTPLGDSGPSRVRRAALIRKPETVHRPSDASDSALSDSTTRSSPNAVGSKRSTALAGIRVSVERSSISTDRSACRGPAPANTTRPPPKKGFFMEARTSRPFSSNQLAYR